MRASGRENEHEKGQTERSRCPHPESRDSRGKRDRQSLCEDSAEHSDELTVGSKPGAGTL